MSRNRLNGSKILVGDFETTVYKGQTNTEVWASAVVELWTENVVIDNNIESTFNYLVELQENIVIYYHNLRFDGTFWLSYFERNEELREAYIPMLQKFYEDEEMYPNMYKYLISDRGMWYSILVKTKYGYFIEFRDSLKLLPFSVKKLGNDFKTKHQKTEIEYVGYRKAGGKITKKEKDYIANDVLVVKEALEIMFEENHNRLTIGSCCMAEFKRTLDYWDYQNMFPNLYDYRLNGTEYCEESAGAYIHRSYKGGWCYLVKGKENKIFKNGVTADVNSLYPSMMSSESGNTYPIGLPKFWKGEFPKYLRNRTNIYYFIHLKTRFRLKPGYLPFIQVKSNPLYKATECLETSDIRDKNGDYHDKYIDIYGNEQPAIIELTLTCTDYILFQEHYHLYDTEYIDGCYFMAETPEGIFDTYINKWKEIKINATGAKRTLAKLFLNNLYGKMATWINNSFKHAFIREDGSLGFEVIESYEGTPGYIAIGSAITSYARNFTIRAAQKNYHGVDQPGFIYADTDSIHCDLPADRLNGIPVHNTDFCHWKLESFWDEAIFVRQKTYIEHITHEDGEPVEKPYYNIKCAGMNDKCKYQFNKSLTHEPINKYDKTHFSKSQIEFMKTPRTLEDFKIGLKIEGKLRPTQIDGGTLLVETTYEMR